MAPPFHGRVLALMLLERFSTFRERKDPGVTGVLRASSLQTTVQLEDVTKYQEYECNLVHGFAPSIQRW